MHAARVGLIVTVAAAAIGCAGRDGMWRDQYIFVADDGLVLALGMVRHASGTAEIKGWFGRDGAWASTAFAQAAIPGAIASDRAASVAAWANAPQARARVMLDRAGGRLALDVRLPSRRVRLRASPLAALGRARDPEGTSVYAASRAQLDDGDRVRRGWLIAEETPAATPRRPFVDYGDFVFLVVAAGDEPPLVIKRSRRRPAFNQAFLGGATPRHASQVLVDIGEHELDAAVPAWDLHLRLSILDRDHAIGVGPGDAPVAYDTLLLGGGHAGVAFVVRPRRRTTL